MLLSIITVNLNNLSGLKKTADSVVTQTCDKYEWIVIDGGSIDGSRDLIEQYSDHISYWVSEPDKGIYNAMNKGVDVATGDYLLFLNSGDWLYDSEVIRDFSERENTEDVIYGEEVVLNDDVAERWRWRNPINGLTLSYFFEKTLAHQATFIHKRCFVNHRYNENHKLNSDWELFMTLFYEKCKFAYFQRVITVYDAKGISSVMLNSELAKNELNDTIANVLPPGVAEDYRELIALRAKNEVWSTLDLAIMCDSIIHSGRFLRHLLRIFMYPIYWLSKISNKC